MTIPLPSDGPVQIVVNDATLHVASTFGAGSTGCGAECKHGVGTVFPHDQLVRVLEDEDSPESLCRRQGCFTGHNLRILERHRDWLWARDEQERDA